MSPYKWRPSSYLCPECDARLESKGGPDGLNAQRCPACEWEKVYDPAADEFAVNELDRVKPVTDGGTSEPGIDRIVLAQCTATKRDEPARAGDIYDESAYFRRQREYARARGDQWFIQSAKHGLLHPDQEIEPYNQHAKNIDDAEAWAESIADDLEEHAEPGSVIEILGGKDYADPLTPELEARGFDVHEPLRGQAIGKRKASLKEMANRTLEGFA